MTGVDLPGGPPLCFPPFDADSRPDKRVRLMDSSALMVSESLPLLLDCLLRNVAVSRNS